MNMSRDSAILRNIVLLLLVLSHRFADNFLDGGNAATNLMQSRLAQRNHAVFNRFLPQLKGRSADQNQFADLVRDFLDSIESDASLIACVIASGTALTLVCLELLGLFRRETDL